MLSRINAHLHPVSVDYERDVLPLTPKGNATERHMLAACVAAVENAYPTRGERVGFWADRLGMSRAQVESLIDDTPNFKNLVRARLMKRGGVGYISPGPDTFPQIGEFHELIVALGALPCYAWLDGTSAGEQDIEELVALMIEQGVVAVNIIPDRNWNVRDPEEKRVKVQNLYDFVRLAQELDLPLNVGTEMNKYGQKRVDDFDAPELAPVREAFIEGALFIYGHTVAQRTLGIGYQSEWARDALPSRRERNAFYTALGRRVPQGRAGLEWLKRVGVRRPGEILSAGD